MDYFEATLAEIRQSIGAPPRRVQREDKYHLEAWCYVNFGMFANFGFDAILKRGEVYWAGIVQANGALFEPDPRGWNYPATVVYSKEEAAARNPTLLERIGGDLYATKGGRSKNPDMARIGAVLANERQPTANLRVPQEFTGGLPCKLIDVAFDRRHMPHGVLSARVVPILVHPKVRWSVMVPYWHWPERYRTEFWAYR